VALDPIAPSAEPIWLLDMDVGGRVERFATRAVEVFTAAGERFVYRAGLGELRTSISDASSSTFSVAVEIDAEPEGSSWAQLSAEGLEPDRRPGTLYRWTPGDELERARVILRGFWFGVQFDKEGEGLTATLARVPLASTRTIPEGPAKVSGRTWPVRDGVFTPGTVFEPDDRVVGAYYPRIYGYPGRPTSGATPGLLAEFRLANPDRQTSVCIIAEGEVDADTVRLFDYDRDEERPVFFDRPVKTTTDKLGRLVSYVDALGLSFNTFHLAPGKSYYVTWRNVAGFGGGRLLPDRSGPIRGWADVVRDLLDETDLEVDWPNFNAEAETLNRWRLDGMINDPADPWDVISRELVPLVPVRLIEGANGLYFRVMRWTAGPELATHRIDVKRSGVERLTLEARPIESVRNRFVLDYAPDRQTNKYQKRMVLTGRIPDNGDDGFRASFRCLQSRKRFELPGRRRSGVFSETLQTDWIENDDVAERMLRSYAARFALPPRPASYRLPLQWEQEIDVGDVVTVNDPEVFLDERVALVDDLTLGAGELVADVLLLEDPARLDRLVP
jgi:hypothetical protein